MPSPPITLAVHQALPVSRSPAPAVEQASPKATPAALTALELALIALAYYRARHARQPRFKKPRRAHHRTMTVSCAPENVRACRHYIRLARQAGWRGSVRAALGIR